MDHADNEQHLRLLSIFHYVVGGLGAFFALFPILYLVVGWFLIHAPPPKHGDAPPAFVGWFVMGFGAFLFVMGEAFAICLIAAGRSLHRRRGYWFIFIMACLQCTFFPFGTVLGVFTIIVLSRPAVKQMFSVSPNAVAAQ